MSAELIVWDFVHPLSVHPCRKYLWTYCMDFFQILVVASPGPYARIFWIFEKKNFDFFYEYFLISLTWDPISKRYSDDKLQPKVLKLLLNFLPNGPYRTTLGFLKFWKFKFQQILLIFNGMGPYGSDNFKTLLLQIATKSFETRPEFSSQWSSQNYVGIFEILSFGFVTFFFPKI